MPNNTQKLGLPNPEVGSVGWDSSWYDMTKKIDNHPGIRTVMSDAMPINPWTGQMVYVEDLKELQVFDGTSWILASEGANGVEVVESSNMPADPHHGMVVYVLDLDELQAFNGTSWNKVGGGDSLYTVAANRAQIPNPKNGQMVAFTDSLTIEVWFIDRWTILHSVFIPRTIFHDFDDISENERPYYVADLWHFARGLYVLYNQANDPGASLYLDPGTSDLLGFYFTDVNINHDIVTTMEINYNNWSSEPGYYYVMNRMNGTQATASCYFAKFAYPHSELSIGKMVDGFEEIFGTIPFNVSDMRYSYIQLSTIGSEIELKVWNVDDPEVSDPDFRYTDPDPLPAGYSGFGSTKNEEFLIASMKFVQMDES